MFFSSKTVASLLLLATCDAKVRTGRELSFERFHTFAPITQVTDHAAIDLDQQEITVHVGSDTPQWGKAQAVYENGAHSKSYAVMTMVNALTTSASEGAEVTGTSQAGEALLGSVYADADSQSQTLQVQYATQDVMANYVGCHVGGSSEPVEDGCT
jgi:hypothetical protein